MKQFIGDSKAVLAVMAIMASPIVLVVAFPLAVALGLGVFATPSGRLMTLALWGGVGVVLLRRILRSTPGHAAALGQPAS